MVRTTERRRRTGGEGERVVEVEREEPVVPEERVEHVEHVEHAEHVEEAPPAYVEPGYGDVVPAWAVVVRRVIYYVLGIVEILLAFRFLLKLFAANPGSPFVAFIYGLTAPLVFPFEGVFRGFAAEGATFEPGTLLAIAVYAVLAWVLDRLVMLVASSARHV